MGIITVGPGKSGLIRDFLLQAISEAGAKLRVFIACPVFNKIDFNRFYFGRYRHVFKSVNATGTEAHTQYGCDHYSGKFQFSSHFNFFLLTSFSTAGIACCVTHFWVLHFVGCLLPPSLTECTSVRRNHAKYSFQSRAPYFYASISYSFNLRYNVRSLMPRSDEASFRLPLCFLSAFIISSFSLSIMFSDSSTSTC